MEYLGKKFYIGGICGVSMSAIAKILKSFGAEVKGSDLNCNGSVAESLRKDGIDVNAGDNLSFIKAFKPDYYVYSVAIKESNIEFEFAKQNAVCILSRGEMLGKISKFYNSVVAISGSHGKTTTTSIISHMLASAFKGDVTAHVGGDALNIGGNLKIGKNNQIFVTEACEYYNSFLNINANISVILNIQSDHLDFFKSVKNLKNAFYRFAKNTKDKGIVLINIDDKNCYTIYKRLKALKRLKNKVYSFSLNNIGADAYLTNVKTLEDGESEFGAKVFGKVIKKVKVTLVGRHNLYNALVGVAVGMLYKLSNIEIKHSLKTFLGVARRYQLIGYNNGVKIIHDYAHHPEELNAVIKETQKYCKGRVFVAFEPHTYSRTKQLWKEFANCLKLPYRSFLLPIYSAREEPVKGVTSLNLCDYINSTGGRCYYIYSYSMFKEVIFNFATDGDVILVLGAGTIDELAKMLVN